jgi:hypothetical protein
VVAENNQHARPSTETTPTTAPDHATASTPPSEILQGRALTNQPEQSTNTAGVADPLEVAQSPIVNNVQMTPEPLVAFTQPVSQHIAQLFEVHALIFEINKVPLSYTINTSSASAPAIPVDDLDTPIAQRRTKRVIYKPRRFRDDLPEAAPALPLVMEQESSDRTETEYTAQATNREDIDISSPMTLDPSPQSIKFFSPTSKFGLWRQYTTESRPSHDPEENTTFQDLCSFPSENSCDLKDILFPYPNPNSFLLGSWYWDDKIQKSQESFNKLVDIVGHPDFKPSDILNTNWKRIDGILGKNSSVIDEWQDEDGGWTKSQVSIAVPFHRFLVDPGLRDHPVVEFHHRSIVSVIKEKLSKPENHSRFHYEPYILNWNVNDKDIRVHGELYCSQTFINEHVKLQNSPPEPNCDLKRVVVALMFWSDATRLSSFGNSQLWPLYLFFGNESKYYRCKPSLHLCEHIAYFEKVCITACNYSPIINLHIAS